MPDIDVIGIGAWGRQFANWGELCTVLAGGDVGETDALKPDLIPARERRRAPLSVKMAVEVMDQACHMAALDPATVATVFASVYGDIQITDYMCTTLASAPRTTSPTKFHNSVHNAATGYWSIATQSHQPANAISAYAYSPTMALVEGAIQAVEENVPVIVAIQELASPPVFKPIYAAGQAFSAALALAPQGYSASPLASMQLSASSSPCDFPALPVTGSVDWADNFAARILPLLAALAAPGNSSLELPMAAGSALSLIIDTRRQAGADDA